jgi:hypothetical protein
MKPMLLLILVLGACASPPARFPLREPMWRDTDLDPVRVACRPDPKKPGHRLCRPDEYESSFAGDGLDNMLTRPWAQIFAVELNGEASNVNSFDETPDSTWFTNRIGRTPMTPEEAARGPCGEESLPVDAPDGSWVIDLGKMNGANPGFRIALPDGRRYMLKADEKGEAERATGATAVATRLYWSAGWWVPCDSVVYVRRSLFSLRRGLTVTDNTGATRPFDETHLTTLLENANRRGDLIRLSASQWLTGRALGPFKYEGTKDDDPNDIIPHENRRDLRGARVIAAWLNHFDSREQNSMNVWLAEDAKDSDSSPGLVRHYYLDLGDCFGSQWSWDEMSRRLGYAYYWDFGYFFADWFTFGFIQRPWDRARRTEDGWIFGYFSSDLDPDDWHGGYPNPAFNHMTERDGAWAARILARFTDEHVAKAVEVGEYTNPRHVAYLDRTLRERRDIILRRYLSVMSPVTDLRVEGNEVCGVDLARRAKVFPDVLFHYGAGATAGGDRKPLPVRPAVSTGDDGAVCVTLPRIAADGGPPPDDASRYLVVSLVNGQGSGPLMIHLYDLGPEKGYRLVGIERQNP